MTVELKSCPLCGDKDEFNPSVSTSYEYAHPGTDSHDLVEAGHFIECDKCACCGPIKPVEEEAIAAWNTRPAQVGDAAERVMKALWPLLGGNHTEAELWGEIGDAVSAALGCAQ